MLFPLSELKVSLKVSHRDLPSTSVYFTRKKMCTALIFWIVTLFKVLTTVTVDNPHFIWSWGNTAVRKRLAHSPQGLERPGRAVRGPQGIPYTPACLAFLVHPGEQQDKGGEKLSKCKRKNNKNNGLVIKDRGKERKRGGQRRRWKDGLQGICRSNMDQNCKSLKWLEPKWWWCREWNLNLQRL